MLVNNAGILIREGLDSPRAAENWRRVLDVNLNGSFNMIHAFLRATRGVIINVGSIASFAGVGAALGYSPSKGGVKMLTQSLARDLAADGIRVNAIAPGVIETPMTASTREDPAKLASFMQRIPLGRVGQPDDLVGPVVFLASSMARYVTGVSLPVDGGFLAVAAGPATPGRNSSSTRSTFHKTQETTMNTKGILSRLSRTAACIALAAGAQQALAQDIKIGFNGDLSRPRRRAARPRCWA